MISTPRPLTTEDRPLCNDCYETATINGRRIRLCTLHAAAPEMRDLLDTLANSRAIGVERIKQYEEARALLARIEAKP